MFDLGVCLARTSLNTRKILRGKLSVRVVHAVIVDCAKKPQ